jgi:hypothetical protein
VAEGKGPQSKIDQQIIDLLVSGTPAKAIARKLDIPVEWVHEVSKYNMPGTEPDYSDPRNSRPANRFGEGVAEDSYEDGIPYKSPKPSPKDSYEDGIPYKRKKGVAEGVATEDVLSTVKKKLDDYLKNIEDEIKSDPDLKDKIKQDTDVVGPAVKTITTDDGHEIKIHGNEDDGFRITIKNKPAKSTFKDLDEASIAVEMFNARRRRAAMPAPEVKVEPEVKVAPRAALLQRLKQNNDYVDEK